MVDRKMCQWCDAEKPITEFHRAPNSKDGYLHMCRACRASGRKAYRVNERRLCNESAQKRADWLRFHKGSTPCLDCARTFPHWLMDFDHREGTTKDRGGVCVNYHLSFTRMRREMAKCDLVCVQCHRHRTYCRREAITWYPLTSVLGRPAERPDRRAR